MILHDVTKPYKGKTGISQDTVYVVGSNSFIKKLVAVDVPVSIFKHDERFLLDSCKKIADSELVVIESNTNIFLPIMLSLQNQFATEVYVADDIYPEIFNLNKSRVIKLVPRTKLFDETKKFFGYLEK